MIFLTLLLRSVSYIAIQTTGKYTRREAATENDYHGCLTSPAESNTHSYRSQSTHDTDDISDHTPYGHGLSRTQIWNFLKTRHYYTIT